MLNIFKRKSKQDTTKQVSAEIKAIQTAAEQYEATRQQLLKNLELINSIL